MRDDEITTLCLTSVNNIVQPRALCRAGGANQDPHQQDPRVSEAWFASTVDPRGPALRQRPCCELLVPSESVVAVASLLTQRVVCPAAKLKTGMCLLCKACNGCLIRL